MRGLIDVAGLANWLSQAALFGAVAAVGLGLTAAGVGLSLASHDTRAAASGLQTAARQDVGAATPEFRVTIGQVGQKGSLVSSLLKAEVPVRAVDRLWRGLAPLFDARQARAGDHFRLLQDAEGRILDFWYSTSELEAYHLYRDSGRLVAERQEPELVRRTARLAGVISTSLYEAVTKLGESPQLASDFAEIFAWDIDFSRAVQRGDEFAILYERLYRIGRDGREAYSGPGRILAARYRGAAGTRQAIYFETEGGGMGGYYRPDGSSVERQFLIAPLRYSRISSSYSSARRHPILKVTRPHPGVDYAAPAGTPVFAVADGKILQSGRAGGFGNLVKIGHPNGYVSYYAHLSRFAKGVAAGQAVRQKQLIGYVGQTGLATGPHVCFRIAKNGRYVNPTALRAPAGDPVVPERMVDFELVRDALLAQLDFRTASATDEAF